jgi:hypothetical protein
MSSIITNTILTNYPVAGVDNDSQGFRDNFTRIQLALAQAKAELIQFENKALLKTNLDGTNVNPVTSDIAGGIIVNGRYNKFYGASNYTSTPGVDGTVVSDVTVSISLWNGIYQAYALAQDTTVTFIQWPDDGQYGNIRVQFTASTSTDVTLTSITSSNGGTVIPDVSFPALTITNDAYYVIEAWSVDHGANVFLKYIGKFNKPT